MIMYRVWYFGNAVTVQELEVLRVTDSMVIRERYEGQDRREAKSSRGVEWFEDKAEAVAHALEVIERKRSNHTRRLEELERDKQEIQELYGS